MMALHLARRAALYLAVSAEQLGAAGAMAAPAIAGAPYQVAFCAHRAAELALLACRQGAGLSTDPACWGHRHRLDCLADGLPRRGLGEPGWPRHDHPALAVLAGHDARRKYPDAPGVPTAFEAGRCLGAAGSLLRATGRALAAHGYDGPHPSTPPLPAAPTPGANPGAGPWPNDPSGRTTRRLAWALCDLRMAARMHAAGLPPYLVCFWAEQAGEMALHAAHTWAGRKGGTWRSPGGHDLGALAGELPAGWETRANPDAQRASRALAPYAVHTMYPDPETTPSVGVARAALGHAHALLTLVRADLAARGHRTLVAPGRAGPSVDSDAPTWTPPPAPRAPLHVR